VWPGRGLGTELSKSIDSFAPRDTDARRRQVLGSVVSADCGAGPKSIAAGLLAMHQVLPRLRLPLRAQAPFVAIASACGQTSAGNCG
jgi:hypothetical protein